VSNNAEKLTRLENNVSFLYSVATTMADPDHFAEAGAGWMGDRLRSLGAMSVTANQVVMGGEMAGQVLVAFETDSADAAMALNAAIYGDSDLLKLLVDAGVKVERRTLMRLQAEFGSRDASHGTILYLAGPPQDDATTQSNMALSWSHLEAGAAGMTAMQVVAGGPSPFTGVVVTWADSMDALLAASAANFADPAVQETMAATNTTVLGRMMTRRLF
jgi:hypothetical protein